MKAHSKELWAVGDWCFCEFELQQVKEMREGRITEVSTGMVSHGGWDLSDRCMPLTMPMKRIADTFDWHSQRIHREGSSGLNYPDIHRWLVDKWVAACAVAEDTERLKSLLEQTSTFVNDVLSKQEVESGYGFPLMRRRVV